MFYRVYLAVVLYIYKNMSNAYYNSFELFIKMADAK